jgi:hypothetical protein
VRVDVQRVLAAVVEHALSRVESDDPDDEYPNLGAAAEGPMEGRFGSLRGGVTD